MNPRLTLSILLSADGKTATRSGEPLVSRSSSGYRQHLSTHRDEADCLLIDTASPVFEIPKNTSVIFFGNSSAWQTTIESLSADKVAMIDDSEDLTPAKLQAAAGKVSVDDIHCEPSVRLTRMLMKEQMVDILNLIVMPSISGGHAADTITGNGASTAFVSSRHFSLISHDQLENEIHLRYESKPQSSGKNS